MGICHRGEKCINEGHNKRTLLNKHSQHITGEGNRINMLTWPLAELERLRPKEDRHLPAVARTEEELLPLCNKEIVTAEGQPFSEVTHFNPYRLKYKIHKVLLVIFPC